MIKGIILSNWNFRMCMYIYAHHILMKRKGLKIKYEEDVFDNINELNYYCHELLKQPLKDIQFRINEFAEEIIKKHGEDYIILEKFAADFFFEDDV